MREKRGAIGFEMPETKVILNDDGTVKDIMPYPINFTNGIIESFMICANEFIAKKFFDLKYPFVYRVHEDPGLGKSGHEVDPEVLIELLRNERKCFFLGNEALKRIQTGDHVALLNADTKGPLAYSAIKNKS